MNNDNTLGTSQSFNDASDDGHKSSSSDSSHSSLLKLQIREQTRVIENLRCTVESQSADLDALSEQLAESHKNLLTQESKRVTLFEEFELLQTLIINPRNRFILPDGEVMRVNAPVPQSVSTTNNELSQGVEDDDLLANASLSNSNPLTNSVGDLAHYIEHSIGTEVSYNNIPGIHDITFAAEGQQQLHVPAEVTFKCKELKHDQLCKSNLLQEADDKVMSSDASSDFLQMMMTKNNFGSLTAVECEDDNDNEHVDKLEQDILTTSSRGKDYDA